MSRAINDINDQGLAIECYLPEKKELDLSYAVFRSVSPVHIQYLQNMGVTATHAISLVIDKVLWGMIIFHHYSGPKYIDFDNRLLAQTLAVNVTQAVEIIRAHDEKKNTDAIEFVLKKITYSEYNSDIFRLLTDNWLLISKHLRLSGFSMMESKRVNDYALELKPEVVFALHNTITSKQWKEPYFTCDKIKDVLPAWDDDTIAGFVCVKISSSLDQYIYFWRKAKAQTINWAGNPEKSMNVEEKNNRTILTPRSSFALWQQKVQDKSSPWLPEDLLLVKKLRETIINFEIKKTNEVILKNNRLINESAMLQGLLTQKTEELHRLNLQLQEELAENKKYQRELEVARLAGEHLNKLKSAIIANMSHELRTPLTGILGLAELIVQDPEHAEEVQQFAGLIVESSHRLLETINRVLSVSRIEHQAIILHYEQIEIVKFVKNVLEPLAVLARNKQQTLTLNVHNEELITVTDKYYLEQILTNLISNAIKYTPDKGAIEINVKNIIEHGAPVVHFSIEDNGLGIDNKLIDKIFDPFFTEKETTKVSDQSTGLGLYLVKNYLQYLNGHITVQSEQGKGSLFCVTIPETLQATPLSQKIFAY